MERITNHSTPFSVNAENMWRFAFSLPTIFRVVLTYSGNFPCLFPLHNDSNKKGGLREFPIYVNSSNRSGSAEF
jgi:hypothetical protein